MSPSSPSATAAFEPPRLITAQVVVGPQGVTVRPGSASILSDHLWRLLALALGLGAFGVAWLLCPEGSNWRKVAALFCAYGLFQGARFLIGTVLSPLLAFLGELHVSFAEGTVRTLTGTVPLREVRALRFDTRSKALFLDRRDGRSVAMPELFKAEPQPHVDAFLGWFNGVAAASANPPAPATPVAVAVAK